jgi:hypothetical protein
MSRHQAASSAALWRRSLMVIMLLIGSLLAARVGMSQWHTRLLEEQVAHLEESLTEAPNRALEEHLAKLNASAMFKPTAAQYELHARALVALASGQRSSVERQRLLRNAREYLLAAARMRPSWPYVWAELAVVKARSGSFDQSFKQAFRRALRSGPHEVRVVRQLFDILLRDPDRLADSLEPELQQIVLTLGRREPANLIETAYRYHRARWLCASAFLETPAQKICAQRGFDSDSAPAP